VPRAKCRLRAADRVVSAQLSTLSRTVRRTVPNVAPTILPETYEGGSVISIVVMEYDYRMLSFQC
jgi:hypothetical protein